MSKSLISLIIIVLSLAAAFLYVKPEYDLMQGHRADVERLNAIFSKSERIEKLIGETKETLDGVGESERESFSIFLPETTDPIRFANNLQYIGRKNGLVLENIVVEESPNGVQKSAGAVPGTAAQEAVQGAVNVFTIGRKAELSQAAYEASLAGGGAEAGATDKKYIPTRASFVLVTTIGSFEMFLNDLERSLRLINITKLSFSLAPELSDVKKGKKSGPPLYQYAITVEAYSLK